MRIAIIGTGQVGQALARGLHGTSHDVVFGSRDPGSASDTGATVLSRTDAVVGADVVILALPWKAVRETVDELGDLTGRIVIDCTNPIGPVSGGLGLVLGHETSGGETVAGWLPGARVVKTLNQTGAEIMAVARDLPRRPVMFLAGDDTGAKAQVSTLLADLGFEPLDAGPLSRARLLEPFAMVWINQAIGQRMGRGWAFSILRTNEVAE